jgi:hypothetical protein
MPYSNEMAYAPSEEALLSIVEQLVRDCIAKITPAPAGPGMGE